MIEILAAAEDPMISGKFIIGLIGAIATGIALVLGKMQGRKEAESRDVSIKKPVPTIQVREEPLWATKPDLDAHIRRTDEQLKEIRQEMNTDIVNLHERINKHSSILSETKGKAEQIDGKVDKLLSLALHTRINDRA